MVDETFALQTEENAERFAAMRPTARLFLPGGAAHRRSAAPSATPTWPATYRLLGERGLRPLYRGAIADQIVRNVKHPPTTAGTDLPAPPGFMRASDLADYRTKVRAPDACAVPRPGRLRHARRRARAARPSASR